MCNIAVKHGLMNIFSSPKVDDHYDEALSGPLYSPLDSLHRPNLAQNPSIREK